MCDKSLFRDLGVPLPGADLERRARIKAALAPIKPVLMQHRNTPEEEMMWRRIYFENKIESLPEDRL